MINLIITDGAGIHLRYELEHDPCRAVLISSPAPGVVHVKHTVVPVVEVERTKLGGARLKAVE